MRRTPTTRFRVLCVGGMEYYVYAKNAKHAAKFFEKNKPVADTKGNALTLVLSSVEAADGPWQTALQEGPTYSGGTVAGS